jgi:hypothetical protein
MSTKIVEVFEWYQLDVHLDLTLRLYTKHFILMCNN